MKTAKLSDVKDRLSAYVELARSGERVRILVRGVPTADLVPVVVSSEDDLPLAELERRGVLRRGSGAVDDHILKPGPRVEGSPSQDLVAERRRR